MFGPIIEALPYSSGSELLITVRSARTADERFADGKSAGKKSKYSE
jgi:hypothetical protein